MASQRAWKPFWFHFGSIFGAILVPESGKGKNVKIEVIVNHSTAEKIIQQVSDEYFENYAVVAYTQTVRVVRGKKYMS